MYKTTEMAYFSHTYEALWAQGPFCNSGKRNNPKSIPRVIILGLQSYPKHAPLAFTYHTPNPLRSARCLLN